jgi:hypothetical protein
MGLETGGTAPNDIGLGVASQLLFRFKYSCAAARGRLETGLRQTENPQVPGNKGGNGPREGDLETYKKTRARAREGARAAATEHVQY